MNGDHYYKDGDVGTAADFGIGDVKDPLDGKTFTSLTIESMMCPGNAECVPGGEQAKIHIVDNDVVMKIAATHQLTIKNVEINGEHALVEGCNTLYCTH